MASPSTNADVEMGPSDQQLSAEARTGDETSTAASDGLSAPNRTSSAWRYPSQPGKLPAYVRAQFRMKTYALIGIQCLVVLGCTLAIDIVMKRMGVKVNLPYTCLMITGSVTVTSLTVLHFVRNVYPANYIAFVTFTLLVSAGWGLSGSVFATYVHFLILGIVCVAMCVATAMQALVLHREFDGFRAVGVPLIVGWAIGSLMVILVGTTLQIEAARILAAIGVSLGQFVWLMLDMNVSLQTCDPDDFMKVIVSMDSTLLVVLSIPIWVIGTCCVHVGRVDTQTEEQQQTTSSA